MNRWVEPTTLTSLCYGAAAFSIAAINNVWVTYNYPFFLDRFEHGSWFVLVEVLFGLWNAINDPLLGWLSDTAEDRRRSPHIWRGGALLSAAFVMAWFPWGSEKNQFFSAMHFLLSLCLYDGALTYVEVNYGSLLADLSPSAHLRAKCNFFASAFAILGSLSVFFAHLVWKENADMRGFQLFSAALAGLSLPGFWITSSFFAGHTSETKEKQPKGVHRIQLVHFCRQLGKQRNFAWFSLVRLLQVFCCTFEKNHLCLFLHFLVGQHLSAASLGTLISLSFVLPHLGIMALTPLLRRGGGVHTTVGKLLVVKALLAFGVLILALGSGSGTFLVGNPGWAMLVFYLCTARVLTECNCRIFPLVVAQLVDEDRYLNTRSQSMAASIVGTTALFSKPGESVAPILGWYLVKKMKSSSAIASFDDTASPGGVDIWATKPEQATQVLWCVLLLPLLCSLLQLLLWRKYSLRGAYLKKIQHHNEASDTKLQQHAALSRTV